MRALGVLIFLLILTVPSAAQVLAPGTPTSSEETITVSTTAIGVTAALCDADNTKGVLVQVLTNAIYVALHGTSATPDSGDFALAAGDYLFVKPASKLRMIRQSANSSVKVQCME